MALSKSGLQAKTALQARDLGIMTAISKRRISHGLIKRLKAARLRSLKIKWLNKINKKAKVLYNTGVWPQGTYGIEATGLHPGQIQHLRTQAADATAIATAGRCPIVAVAVAIGTNRDPYIQGPTQILKQWIWLAKHPSIQLHPKPLQTTWALAYANLQKANRPWSIVKGPMTATIAHLLQMGVTPLGPLKWGYEGKVSNLEDGPPGIILQELEHIKEKQVWQEASLHRYGSGLELGCDLTAIKQHYHYLVQQGKSGKAGWLMCIAAGGL